MAGVLAVGAGMNPAMGSTPNYSPYLGGGSVSQSGSIPSSLPWSNPGTIDFSGNPANLGQEYASAYNSALNFNQANYNNIAQGYSQTAANQANALNQVQQGYGQLSTDVLAGIQGIGSSQAQAIMDQYAQQQGQQNQQLINRGLGNTTIQSAVDRGLVFDRTKAQNNLANQIAGTNAQYQSQLGQAGLQFGNQAALENSGQANQQLNWQNSVNAPYPNSQLYAQLAQQYGAAQQANANRALQSQLAAQAYGAGNRSGGTLPASGSSYTPAPLMPAAPQAGSYGAPGGGNNAGFLSPSSQSPYGSSGSGNGYSMLANYATADYTDPTGQWAGGPTGGADDYSDPTGQWAGGPTGGGGNGFSMLGNYASGGDATNYDPYAYLDDSSY